jgi:hypothetical protein
VGKTTTKTKTREKLLTKEQVARALPLVDLSPEEEIVIRLRYGIGMQPEDKLTFRGKGNDELEARLALLEKAILEQLEDQGGTGDAADIDDLLSDL